MVLFHPNWTTTMSCFFGKLHCLIQKLQYVHNAATRFIAHSKEWKYNHVTHIRRALYWLTIKQRIDFKVFVSVCIKVPIHIVPSLLIRTDHKPTKRLWSCDEYHLVEHKTKTTLYGDIVFQNAAHTLWNMIPVYYHQSESLAQFKHHFKSYIF